MRRRNPQDETNQQETLNASPSRARLDRLSVLYGAMFLLYI